MDRNELEKHIQNLGISESSTQLIINYFFSSNETILAKQLEFQHIILLTQLIELVKDGKKPNDNHKSLILKICDAIINSRSFFIPYDFIAFFIFNDQYDYDANYIERSYGDLIDNSNMLDQIDASSENKEQGEEISKIFQKIQRHILLAIHQKSYISDQAEKAKALSTDAQKRYEQIDKDISNLHKNIYTNFITILGVFTAIIVTIFGGFTAVTDAVKNFYSSMDYLFLLTSGLFFVSIIIYLLFSWLERLKKPDNKNTPLKIIRFIGAFLVFIILIKIAKLFSDNFPPWIQIILQNL